MSMSKIQGQILLTKNKPVSVVNIIEFLFCYICHKHCGDICYICHKHIINILDK